MPHRWRRQLRSCGAGPAWAGCSSCHHGGRSNLGKGRQRRIQLTLSITLRILHKVDGQVPRSPAHLQTQARIRCRAPPPTGCALLGTAAQEALLPEPPPQRRACGRAAPASRLPARRCPTPVGRRRPPPPAAPAAAAGGKTLKPPRVYPPQLTAALLQRGRAPPALPWCAAGIR